MISALLPRFSIKQEKPLFSIEIQEKKIEVKIAKLVLKFDIS